ncbi:MAG: MFS transporter [Candidatus Helarchaeota archaeon]|nr:MFS transporter [Candidatus Helarchaeota archaeon]
MTETVNYGDNEKIPLKVNMVYGLGNMGTSLLTGIFDGAIVKYYTDKVFLEPIYIGIAFLIFAIWNALNDPIFGNMSDKTRTKIGRRIPYLRVTSFIFGIAFILLWFPPIGTQIEIFIYLLITIFFFDTCFTIYGLCYIALMPELSLDPNERTKLSLYMTVFGMIAVMITFLIPFMFLTRIGGKAEFQFICIIIAIVGTILIILAAFTLKERVGFYDKEKSFGLIENTKYCLKNKSFITFVIYNFGITLIFSNLVTSILYYTQYVINLTGAAVFLPLIIVIAGFFITYFLTPRLDEKFGFRKSLLITGVFGIFGFLLLLIPDVVLSSIAISIIAASLAVYAILGNPMIADICDDDEIKTGTRREGSFFGINALVTKPAISLGVFILTFMLNYSEYFPQITEYFGFPQSVGVKIAIQITMGLIFAGVFGLSLISLYFYPIHGEYYSRLKEEIKKRHL